MVSIIYKYEGMLAHSVDRFYVVTKFMLSMIGYLKFSKLDFDDTCTYMDSKYAQNTESRKYMLDLKNFVIKSTICDLLQKIDKLIQQYCT